MATKYKKFFDDMYASHQELFDGFSDVHEKYMADPDKYQNIYNEEGEKILPIIRKYENLLCNTSESSRYGKFSANLADKFKDEIRKHFPRIDFIGIH